MGHDASQSRSSADFGVTPGRTSRVRVELSDSESTLSLSDILSCSESKPVLHIMAAATCRETALSLSVFVLLGFLGIPLGSVLWCLFLGFNWSPSDRGLFAGGAIPALGRGLATINDGRIGPKLRKAAGSRPRTAGLGVLRKPLLAIALPGDEGRRRMDDRGRVKRRALLPERSGDASDGAEARCEI
ncbi:hypothetical protein NDU88_002284 [Pleurodeles waltl]|uniref:Uncharacterized protein n=1 Tax=Pleurodeles waltl TaxID=8319 RepID=A0AAV7KVN6_PLEWA|nr:hypothetical protein NDU88_002284 [Pleurodeles waltl]